MKAPENAYTVILAGGGGTRLWPKSRKKHPKHLLKLFRKETLLKTTYDRIAPIIPDERILVITASDHAGLISKELPNLPKENIIIEPQAKNTALAMGVAAVFIHSRNPDAVIINLAADHIYKDIERFQKTALAALDVAASYPYIVSIGIKPTYAHTGLGYIRVGDQLGQVKVIDKDLFAFKCKGFKEKPDLATAQSFLATGNYLWNANLYTWSTKTVLGAFRKYAPEIYEGLEKILGSIGTENEEKVLEQVYEKIENIQIDTAISEKTDNLVVIPGDFGWSDIGDWKVIYDTLDKDEYGNVVVDSEEELVGVGNKNCLIETNGRLVVAVGLENLAVVDTQDAILICPLDRTQDVKKAVEKLKELKKDKYL